MRLSILTPTIPQRLHLAGKLHASVAAQARRLDAEIEHLILCDNRARTIGAKRQALLDMARGDYVAFCDDDDLIRGNYLEALLPALELGADVVTFAQHSVYNGQESTVVFRLGQGDHPYAPGEVTRRDAWHVCAWRRAVVAGCQFGETNYGEDLIWCRQARRRARTTHHIPEVLHEYHHDARTTAAPEPV